MSNQNRDRSREPTARHTVDAAKLASTAPEPAEPMWMGWAVIAGDGGWRRARLVLPESVVREHAIEIAAPDVRAIVAARIEQDLVSDRMVDRRGWEPKR